MQTIDSEDPRVEMLKTSGFSRWVAVRQVARAFASAMGVFFASPLLCCPSSSFALSLDGALVGREGIEVRSSRRYMSTPLTRSQAAKIYFPKDA